MTNAVFQDWITGFNKRMKAQHRNIIFLLENATLHSQVNLNNVKIVFLPPKAKSVLQPLDQGIIHAFKAHYKKRLVHSVLSNMDKSKLGESVSVLEACVWINSSMRETKTSTVSKCFTKCFISSPSIDNSEDEDY
ncbi:tigger transposable element-derived protein 6-like [Limulus polyphemus]|uniref:Tigger transposable element-derived protein 6-like n=1 Tax=Limulus polyphemus TaxID=6850 RepID=A0ABM1BR55_LIMPO|nr:tigger transposable element-derived protein 6-like [Limulus polyphemus]